MFFPNPAEKENEIAESVPDIDKMIRKTKIMENRIKDQDNRINNLIKENKDYLTIICKIDTFMNKEGFYDFQDLIDFTEKWKNHICKNENVNNNINEDTTSKDKSSQDVILNVNNNKNKTSQNRIFENIIFTNEKNNESNNNIESDSLDFVNIQNENTSPNAKNENVKDNNEDITSKDKSLNIDDNVNKKKKNKDVKDLCPISICNKNDDRWKKHIVNKTNKSLIYNNELYDIFTNDNIDINNAADFILYIKKLKNTDSNRNNVKSKIKRCIHIYNIHKNDLKYIYFSINKMSRLNNSNYNKWLDYLNDKINSFKNTETDNTDADNNNKNKTSQIEILENDKHIPEFNNEDVTSKDKTLDNMYIYKSCLKCKNIYKSYINNINVRTCDDCNDFDNTENKLNDDSDEYKDNDVTYSEDIDFDDPNDDC